MVGGIQGNVADAAIALLKFHGVEPAIKWVDNFIFFRSPIVSSLGTSSPPSFTFNLKTIKQITDPLSILWHPLSKKGHDFQSFFSYVGFKWDIDSKTVTISSKKCLCLISKIVSLLSIPHLCVNKKTVASIYGSLQHVTLFYQQGQVHLSALSRFLSKFPNDHILHHLPTSCLHQLSWWSMALAIPNPSYLLIKLPLVDLDIWVDASTSWGIGLYVGGQCATW